MVHRICQQHGLISFFLITLLLLCPFVATSATEFPFKNGEILTYDVDWLFFKAGKAVSSIRDDVKNTKTDSFHFNLHTITTNVVGHIWTMDDNFDTYWDKNLKATTKLTVKIRESTYKKDKEVIFYHDKGISIVKQNQDPPKEYKILKGSNDFFTAGHYARLLPLELNKKYTYPVFEDNESYLMEIDVVDKEKIEIMDGFINTIKTRIRVEFEGAFQSKGKLTVWYADDEFKAPVKMKLSSFFGSVYLTLIKYEGVAINIVKPKK